MPAVDATIFNDRCLVVFHPDCLHGTFPDTFITILTIVRFCIDGSQLHGNSSCKILYKRDRFTSSYTLSSIRIIGPLLHNSSHKCPQKSISASKLFSLRYFLIAPRFVLFPREKQELPKQILIWRFDILVIVRLSCCCFLRYKSRIFIVINPIILQL